MPKPCAAWDILASSKSLSPKTFFYSPNNQKRKKSLSVQQDLFPPMYSIYQPVLARLHLLWPALLGLAFAYLLSGAMHFTRDLQPQPGLETQSLASKSRKEPAWAGIIVQKNILDLEVPQQNPTSSPSQAEGGPTSWRLLGTFTGEKELALISISGQSELFRPGQSTQGWELTVIKPRTTLWKSGTQRQALHMWTENSDSQGTQRPDTTNTQEQSASTRVTLSSRDIQSVLQDPNTLLQMARFAPSHQQGEPRGFRITEVQPDSLLAQLGVENGDVLTRIDGRRITGPTDLLQAYSSLEQSSLVSMDILRQGEHQSFVVEIK